MSRRVEAALQSSICLLTEQLTVKDTQIAVLSQQNQRLIAAALAASANPAGAPIMRIRTKVDEAEPKAPIQHAVGM